MDKFGIKVMGGLVVAGSIGLAGCAGEDGGGGFATTLISAGLAVYLIDAGADPDDVINAFTNGTTGSNNNNANGDSSNPRGDISTVYNYCEYNISVEIPDVGFSASLSSDTGQRWFEEVQCTSGETLNVSAQGVYLGTVSCGADINIGLDLGRC